MHGTLIGITTLSQTGPRGNGNEEVNPLYPELEPHHWMQFSVISRTALFEKFLIFCKGYSSHVLTEQNNLVALQQILCTAMIERQTLPSH